MTAPSSRQEKKYLETIPYQNLPLVEIHPNNVKRKKEHDFEAKNFSKNEIKPFENRDAESSRHNTANHGTFKNEKYPDLRIETNPKKISKHSSISVTLFQKIQGIGLGAAAVGVKIAQGAKNGGQKIAEAARNQKKVSPEEHPPELLTVKNSGAVVETGAPTTESTAAISNNITETPMTNFDMKKEDVHFVGYYKSFFESGDEKLFLKNCTKKIQAEVHTKNVECLSTRAGSIIVTLQGVEADLQNVLEWLSRVNSFEVEGFPSLKAPKEKHIKDIKQAKPANQPTALWIYFVAIGIPVLVVLISVITYFYIKHSKHNVPCVGNDDCHKPNDIIAPKDVESGSYLEQSTINEESFNDFDITTDLENLKKEESAHKTFMKEIHNKIAKMGDHEELIEVVNDLFAEDFKNDGDLVAADNPEEREMDTEKFEGLIAEIERDCDHLNLVINNKPTSQLLLWQ